jgi:putative porin
MLNSVRVSSFVCAFCFLLVTVAQLTKAQTVSDSSVVSSIETKSVAIENRSTEKPKPTDAERIAALEDAVRIQNAQLEELRSSLAEQTRLLNELLVVHAEKEYPVTGTPTPASNAEVTAQANDRLSAVEAQAKKTSEALTKQLGSITFSGDLRLRFESIFGQSNSLANAANPSAFGNELTPRFRPRIRLRLAMRGQINEEFDWGLRLATGSFADNISTNQTLTDFFNRKPFGLDQAFVNYRPKAVRGLRLQGGRFESPWTFTEMTFDSDLQYEGLNESYSRDFKSKVKNLTFVAWQLPFLERNSAFVRNGDGSVNVDQSHRGGKDLALFGAQLRTRIEPNSKVTLALSAADHYFSGTQFISPVQVFGSQLQLPITINIPASGSTPAQTITTQVSIPRDLLVAGNANLGLTTASNNATNRDGRLSSGFNLVDLIARLDLKHSKRFPVTLLFNFVTNTQTHDVVTAGPGGANLILPNHENNGYWAEVQVGKTSERGDFQLGYTLTRIEKDAVLTPFNFSDVTQQSDIRAHRFNFAYAIDPRVTFALTGIITERPTGLLGAFGNTPPGSLNRNTSRLQFDTVFKF